MHLEKSDRSVQFMSLLEAHKGILYKVARSYCKNAADRQDLIQEISLQLWCSFERYSSQYKYSTWVYRVALNTAISSYRKQHNKPQINNELTPLILDFTDDWPPGNDTEDLGQLYQFIAELKAFDRALILLYLEEKSHQEIAEILGITVTNVGTKVSRIKQLLKQKFSTINR